MPFPPKAFIIGAQRAGTTSLAALLDQHPDVAVSTPKEPDFFSVNWDAGLDWYRARFRRLDATLIDASVSYAMARRLPSSRELSDDVPRRIHQISPDARFIYLIRDPAERCYSAYWHEVRAGRERRSLREAIDRMPYYVMASYYYLQITPYLRSFPLDRFLFVRFEDFSRDPVGVARACCRFFGVADDFAFRREEPKNQSFLYSGFGKALIDIAGEDRMKALSRVVAKSLPQALHPLAKRIVTRTVPELSPADRAWLTQRFADDAAAFGRLAGFQVMDVPTARAPAMTTVS